jgi:hypothetical protein
MMIKDLTAQVFKKITVLRRVKNGRWGNVQWLCRCECGREIVVRSNHLVSERTKSCGKCPNRFELFSGDIAIWLDMKDHDVVCWIDAADYPLVKDYRWFTLKAPKTFYVRACLRRPQSHRKSVLMHVLLAGKGTDHIDHDGTNNRRKNLRPASDAENNI